MNPATQMLRKAFWNIGVKAKLFPNTAPFMWPTNVDGMVQWQMGNFLNYVQDGFALNSIIYAAIMYKVKAITQATPRAYIGDPTSPELLPLNHPLARLAVRPNQYMSWIELQSIIETYLNISGNCYLVIDRNNSKGGIPGALWPIRPDEMFIIPDDHGLKGYYYVPRTSTVQDGIPILTEDVIHVKFPNPMDNFEGLGYGLSPMAPMARSGDVDNQVTKFLKLFFDRGAMPVGLLKYNIPLDKETVATIKGRWRDIYGGVDNWTDVGVLDSGGSYEKMSQTFEEMGFNALDERNESRIIAPFGVPPILLGTRFGLAHATYSNYEEARRAFWEDTMTYEIRLFQSEMQYHLLGDDGAFIHYDVGQVPAMRVDFTPMVDSAIKLFNMGVPLNTALKTVGIRMPPIEGGDVSYIPSSVREAGTPPVGAAVPPQKSNKESAEQQIALAAKTRLLVEKKKKQTAGLVGIMDEWDKTFAEGAVEAFKNDLNELLAIVQDVAGKALTAKASIHWNDVTKRFEDYLAEAGSENWRSVFMPKIAGIVNDSGKFWSAELGGTFSLRSVMSEAWFKDYTLEFAQPINKTTSDSVQEIIHQAQAEGWSNQVLQKRLQDVFDVWMKGNPDGETFDWLKSRMPDYRAEAIARTETMRAANAGTKELLDSWGVKKKNGVVLTTEESATLT